MSRARSGVGRMLGRALLRRCPRCGRGGLFRRWFSMVESYPDLDARVATFGALAVLAVVPALFYPYSKTLWAAIDLLLHRMDPQDADTAWGGDPRD